LQIESPELTEFNGAGNFPAGGLVFDVTLFEPEDGDSIVDSAAFAFQHYAYSHETRT
jgi:hypothetical protein